MAEQNNGSTLFTVAPPPNNEIENYFHDPSNSKEVPLDCEGRAWNRTHYRYDAKNLPKTTVSVNGVLPVSFIGGQVILTGAVTSITLPTATQLKTQIESVWGAGTSTFGYPWAWVVRTEFDNQTAGAVTLVMGTGDVPLPAAGITFPANSLSEVEFQILNSSPTATSIRVALLANSTAASLGPTTLTDGGTNETIIVDGTGPDLVIKDFAAGFLQQDLDYFDNIGASFQNRVAAGTLYLTLPDTGVRNAGDLQFLGATDYDTIVNTLAALTASGGNTLFLPPYKTWDLGSNTLVVAGRTITGGGQESLTFVTANDNVAIQMTNGFLRYLDFTGNIGDAQPTNYIVEANLSVSSSIEECRFNRMGLSISTGGVVRHCTFRQHRNMRALNVDATTSDWTGTLEDLRFTIINSSLQGPFTYTSQDSGGQPWLSGVSYTAGDFVTSGGGVYVLVTPGGGASTDAPTGFSASNPAGADGYVWGYTVPSDSTMLYLDSPQNVTESNIIHSLFTDLRFGLGYHAIFGSLGRNCTYKGCKTNACLYFFNATQEFPFRGVQFVGCSCSNASIGGQIYADEGVPKDELVISGCSFQDISYYALWIQAGSNPASGTATQHANIVICGNNFSNYNALGDVSGGLNIVNYSGTADDYYTNISITGNTFLSSVSDYAIVLDNGSASSETIRLVCTSNCVILGGITDGINNTNMPAVANQVIYDNNV